MSGIVIAITSSSMIARGSG